MCIIEIYLEAPDNEKHIHAKDFIKDVKSHIKAISGREYIDIENGTVDCALMFIPNEKIYGFIFDTDASVLDEAARQNIIICSPVTAISVLAVIRQAAQNFTIEKKAKELMKAMAAFRKEWIKYSEGFNKLGETINRAAEEYGTLRSTRSNKLESSIRKLEDLKEDDENI
ncbi:MAG: DNA recombination protein RmuC, partial [Mucispirillum sp.]|nr:DNA recombination protein RmuC [Mucispirillum sp.]